MQSLKQHLDDFLPYLMAGMAIVVGIYFFWLLVFVLLWGTLVGLILFALAKAKQTLWPKNHQPSKNERIIDIDTDS